MLLVPAEHKKSFSPTGLSPHCYRRGVAGNGICPGHGTFLKETKHDLMKSRLILLFHFPFRKGGGRIVIWSIWFHICSRNYPRHKSTFLSSILKHPRELLLPGHAPCPHSLFHGHRAADRLPEKSSCHCYRRSLGSQNFCVSVISVLCSALHEGFRVKPKPSSVV